MTEEIFERRYTQRIAWTDNYTDLRPIIGFLKEIAGLIHEYDEECIKYVSIIQDDLYERRIIPFKIENARDWSKFESIPKDDVYKILYYVRLAFEYKEDDRWRKDCSNIRD